MAKFVRLFTKPDCTLCHPVKFVIQKVQQHIPFRYEEVDISSERNKNWFELYKYDIPVVHFNGVEIARHKLDERVLVSALQSDGTDSARDGSNNA